MIWASLSVLGAVAAALLERERSARDPEVLRRRVASFMLSRASSDTTRLEDALIDALELPADALLGVGSGRIAVRLGEGVVLKAAWNPLGLIGNRSEIHHWEQAGPKARSRMVPLLGYDLEGLFVLQPEAKLTCNEWEDAEAIEEALRESFELERYQVDELVGENLALWEGQACTLDYEFLSPEDVSTYKKRPEAAWWDFLGTAARALRVPSSKTPYEDAMAALLRRWAHAKLQQSPDGLEDDEWKRPAWNHGWQWLGTGSARAVYDIGLRDSVAFKIALDDGGARDNLTEARFWAQAKGTPLEACLVPVIDVHPEGLWLKMERVSRAGPRTQISSACDRLLSRAGVRDITSANMDHRGRMLDYGWIWE